jgi:hypothetical protein
MALSDQGILDLISNLSSQGETGRLQITAGMTEGAFFFDKGQLVDARVGKLTGFQAINAVASIPDATFSFDPSIAPPVQSTITPSERILLKDFFGIDAVERGHGQDRDGLIWPDDNVVPEKVVPLSEVVELEDTSTLVAEPTTGSISDGHLIPDAVPDAKDEVTLVHSQAPRAASRRPLLFATALMILIAAAAVFAIVYRSRERSSAPATAAAVATPAPAETSQPPSAEAVTTAAAPDLSGNWKVVNTVEQTSFQAFRNLEVGFNLAIDQSGKDFTGRGEKVSENGRSLPQTSRTPIELKGSIEGDRIEATFSESGSARKTTGRFVWRIDKASGALTGTFSSNAARARGKSAATKQL